MIAGMGQANAIRTAPRARPGTHGSMGFTVPEELRAESTVGSMAVGVPSFLALQESEAETVRDREARRHGHSMLDALSRLQRALLGGAGADALEQLARLVRTAPEPLDPRLAAVQRAVLVRVAVELARGRVEVPL